jgi:hypothetical protein
MAHYNSNQEAEYYVHADTPEDAAAKLAIQLFKSGILKQDHPA